MDLTSSLITVEEDALELLVFVTEVGLAGGAIMGMALDSLLAVGMGGDGITLR